MSKADLADVAWDLALRLVGADDATKAGELISKVHGDLDFYRDQQREEMRQNAKRLPCADGAGRSTHGYQTTR